MKLTAEQIEIVNSNAKEIKILAGAGAAKTTTLVEYVRLRPNKNFLYIAFNKSVEQEAKRKFKFSNVVIKTAHGLAYSGFVRQGKYRVTNELKFEDVAKLWDEKFRTFTDFNKYIYDVKKAFETFCTFPENRRLKASEMPNCTAKYLNNVNNGVQVVIKAMLAKKIEMTHDAYLKFYLITKPELDYDCILFDEGQDASPVMLSIFDSQDCQKIIVGDNNQSIYRFRKAINALIELDYKSYQLSTSFRFGQEIAQKANTILQAKQYLGMETDFFVTGLGVVPDNNETAMICRTNLAVLMFILNHPKEKVYLEGGAKGYDFTSAGLLSDVYKLHKKQHGLIKSDLIRDFKDLSELDKFAKDRNDFKILNCIELIKKFGGNIFAEIKSAKSRCVTNRKNATIILTTIHKSKGMEYGHVILNEDISSIPELIDRYKKTPKTKDNFLELQEELNLLYVAITRAIKKISYEF